MKWGRTCERGDLLMSLSTHHEPQLYLRTNQGMHLTLNKKAWLHALNFYDPCGSWARPRPASVLFIASVRGQENQLRVWQAEPYEPARMGSGGVLLYSFLFHPAAECWTELSRFSYFAHYHNHSLPKAWQLCPSPHHPALCLYISESQSFQVLY